MLREVSQLIKESDLFLNANRIDKEHFFDYLEECEKLFIKIIKDDFDDSIKSNAFKGLKPFENKPIFNYLIFRWFYRVVMYKIAFNYGMYFMVGKTETDKFKQRTYKIREQLAAIKFKLKNPHI